MSQSHPADVPAGPEGVRSPVTLRSTENGPAAGGSFFEQVGGHDTFDRLVRAFYDGVQQDPVLWPMYPAHDLEGAVQRLTMFLEQYWGGPGTYSEQRGHPRLRMRHAAYKVGPKARDAWLANMRRALDTLELSPLDDATLWSYLDRAAHSLLNTFED
ncbi:globin [Salinibacterium sp. dk2585]|uniref:globin n=1 Tax=unclassified Salinibacterium TaxID=2632331 RepID=UPI0011C249AC|nr:MULTISPECIES: globin [unclassified Salinibacterium]QEE61483.1 globin [Salinibacterium sp. dk2585]TXK54160.1 globin [Salinibacterium sp. dk5596]